MTHDLQSRNYKDRSYRSYTDKNRLVSFQVAVKETDLYIKTLLNLEDEALTSILKYRYHLEEYIKRHPQFKTSLSSLPSDPISPQIVKEMTEAGLLAGVGPMASVAGAIAEFVGNDLLSYCPEVIVENGGDIFINVKKDIKIGIFAGNSLLSKKIGLRISCSLSPLGVCTSSGTVGHSLSFGKADAVTIVSKSTTLADAAATAVGNVVKSASHIEDGLEAAQNIKGVLGTIIIVADKLGAWGDVDLCSFEDGESLCF
ncbi:MAG: UPF0280 family protein [Thermodesulfobacteriota bacterium]|nr:UPF0280 family protein [Thermodesulfobacteriota bacterium]